MNPNERKPNLAAFPPLLFLILIPILLVAFKHGRVVEVSPVCVFDDTENKAVMVKLVENIAVFNSSISNMRLSPVGVIRSPVTGWKYHPWTYLHSSRLPSFIDWLNRQTLSRFYMPTHSYQRGGGSTVIGDLKANFHFASIHDSGTPPFVGRTFPSTGARIQICPLMNSRSSLLLVSNSSQSDRKPSNEDCCNGCDRPIVSVQKLPNASGVITAHDVDEGYTFLRGIACLIIFGLAYAILKFFRITDEP